LEHPEVMHCSIQWSSIKKNTRYSIESCRSIIKFFSAYKVNASIEIIVSLARIDELWKIFLQKVWGKVLWNTLYRGTKVRLDSCRNETFMNIVRLYDQIDPSCWQLFECPRKAESMACVREAAKKVIFLMTVPLRGRGG